MSAFKKRGKWAYRVLVTLPDGTKRRIYGVPAIDTKAEAEAAERAHVERTLHPVEAQKLIPTFADFAKDWLATAPKADGNRMSTIEAKSQHLERHLVPILGKKRLDEISNRVISELTAKLRETLCATRAVSKRCRLKAPSELAKEKGPKVLSPTTVRRILQTLRCALNAAVGWDLLPKLPHFPRWGKAEKKGFAFYVREETDRMIGAETDPEAKGMLAFAVKSGLRQGEQAALHWDDIDFVGRKITVRRSIRNGRTTSTKTHSVREVPLSAEAAHLLKAARHLRGPLVFCDRDGHALKPWDFKTCLRRAAKRVGLRVLRWHDLRHTFASQLVMASVPLKMIQQWLGHAEITMTMRYSHLAPGAGHEMIDVLDAPVTASATG